MRALTCYCKGHCPQHLDDPSKDGTCEAKENASCFSAVEEVLDPETNRLVPERTYGCLPPDETGFLQCKGKTTFKAYIRLLALKSALLFSNIEIAMETS